MNAANEPYRAVTIKPDTAECCAAARQQASARYLRNDAPLLPLPDCTNRDGCRCKYQHWADRRQEDRRALKTGIASQYFDGAERRVRDDRRSS